MPILNLTTGLGASNQVFINSSYVSANQPPLMTTPTVWLFFIASGMLLLLGSRAISEPTFKDLAGIMSAPLLLISALQAFAVDTITGTAIITTSTAPYMGAIVENHIIYHYDLFGVTLFLFFLLSCANLYLLWLDHGKVVQQEQPKADMSMRGNGMNRSARNERPDDVED